MHDDDDTDDTPVFPDDFSDPCAACGRTAFGFELCPECEAEADLEVA